ncbi:MAG: helix-turn-helix domain-containing protein [Arenicellales bacterium]
MNTVAYQSIEPCPELRPFIRRLIVARGDGFENAVMRPIPTGYNYLLWVYDGELSISIDRRKSQMLRGLNFIGQWRKHDVIIKSRGRTSHVLAEFTGTGLYRLAHLSGATIHGRALEAERVAPQVHTRLTDCLNTPLVDIQSRPRALEDALLACAEHSLPEIDYLEHTSRAIEAMDGRVRISELSEEIGISQRQLTRSFRNIVGLGPKFLSRVLQANTAFTALVGGKAESLVALAQACGYYDQAHFIRAMQDIFRYTPGALSRNSPVELAEFLRGSRRFGKTG